MLEKIMCSILSVLMLITGTLLFDTGNVQAQETQEPAYVDNEVIVVFEDDISNKKAEQISGGDVTTLDSSENIVLVEYDKKTNEEKVAEKLEESPQVKIAQPNYIYTSDASGSTTKDTYGANQWNLDYIDAPEAWDLIDKLKPVSTRKASDKIKVATLDTGINTNHPDLNANVDKSNCVTVADSEKPYQQYETVKWSHGTAVAGIIAATSNNGSGCAGVASGNHNDLIELMAVNVFRDDTYKSQGGATTADVINGLDYACSHGAKVINMCLGHTSPSVDSTGAAHNDVALKAAVDNAVKEKGVLITCSAGNNNDTRVWYPSDFDSVISVINTEQYTDIDSICKSPSSSYGNAKDISAPGTNVYTTRLNGTCSAGSGTSLAAPTVAGVAAMMLYVDPTLTVEDVKALLYSTATDLYTEGYDIYTGYGNVNAYAAVAAAAGKSDRLKAAPLPNVDFSVTSTGKSSLNLQWKNVTGASKYCIYRSTSKKTGYKLVKTINKNTTQWKNTGLTFNKRYYYKIKAFGTSSDGKRCESASSAVKYMKPRAAIPAFSVKSSDYETNRIQWKKASSASGYRIYRSKSKSNGYKAIKTIKKAASGSFKDKGLAPGKNYYYKMKSYRTKSSSNYYTVSSKAILHKTVPATPSLSLQRKASAIKVIAGKVSKINGYQIARKNGSSWKTIKTLKNITTSSLKTWTNNSLTKGKSYSYRIRAYKTVNGKRIYSNWSSIKSQTL